MITLSIKAPVKETFVHSLMSRINQQRTGGYVSPLPSQPKTIIGGLQRMTKDAFVPFIEKVKQDYKVGDLVCFAHFSPRAGELPGLIYTLEAINELWYDCVLDDASGQPRCMFIRGKMTGHSGFAAVPGALRHLTVQEKELVDLQDRPAFGTA